VTPEQLAELDAMIADAKRQRDEAQAAYLRLDGAIQALQLMRDKFGAPTEA